MANHREPDWDQRGASESRRPAHLDVGAIFSGIHELLAVGVVAGTFAN